MVHGHLWSLIQEHLDETGMREAELARRIGTSPATVNSWKRRGIRGMPEARLLRALGVEIRKPYPKVLEAVLLDMNYISEGEDPSDELLAAAFAPGLNADQRRRIIDIIREDRPMAKSSKPRQEAGPQSEAR